MHLGRVSRSQARHIDFQTVIPARVVGVHIVDDDIALPTGDVGQTDPRAKVTRIVGGDVSQHDIQRNHLIADRNIHAVVTRAQEAAAEDRHPAQRGGGGGGDDLQTRALGVVRIDIGQVQTDGGAADVDQGVDAIGSGVEPTGVREVQRIGPEVRQCGAVEHVEVQPFLTRSQPLDVVQCRHCQCSVVDDQVHSPSIGIVDVQTIQVQESRPGIDQEREAIGCGTLSGERLGIEREAGTGSGAEVKAIIRGVVGQDIVEIDHSSRPGSADIDQQAIEGSGQAVVREVAVRDRGDQTGPIRDGQIQTGTIVASDVHLIHRQIECGTEPIHETLNGSGDGGDRRIHIGSRSHGVGPVAHDIDVAQVGGDVTPGFRQDHNAMTGIVVEVDIRHRGIHGAAIPGTEFERRGRPDVRPVQREADEGQRAVRTADIQVAINISTDEVDVDRAAIVHRDVKRAFFVAQDVGVVEVERDLGIARHRVVAIGGRGDAVADPVTNDPGGRSVDEVAVVVDLAIEDVDDRAAQLGRHDIINAVIGGDIDAVTPVVVDVGVVEGQNRQRGIVERGVGIHVDQHAVAIVAADFRIQDSHPDEAVTIHGDVDAVFLGARIGGIVLEGDGVEGQARDIPDAVADIGHVVGHDSQAVAGARSPVQAVVVDLSVDERRSDDVGVVQAEVDAVPAGALDREVVDNELGPSVVGQVRHDAVVGGPIQIGSPSRGSRESQSDQAVVTGDVDAVSACTGERPGVEQLDCGVGGRGIDPDRIIPRTRPGGQSVDDDIRGRVRGDDINGIVTGGIQVEDAVEGGVDRRARDGIDPQAISTRPVARHVAVAVDGEQGCVGVELHRIATGIIQGNAVVQIQSERGAGPVHSNRIVSGVVEVAVVERDRRGRVEQGQVETVVPGKRDLTVVQSGVERAVPRGIHMDAIQRRIGDVAVVQRDVRHSPVRERSQDAVLAHRVSGHRHIRVADDRIQPRSQAIAQEPQSVLTGSGRDGIEIEVDDRATQEGDVGHVAAGIQQRAAGELHVEQRGIDGFDVNRVITRIVHRRILEVERGRRGVQQDLQAIISGLHVPREVAVGDIAVQSGTRDQFQMQTIDPGIAEVRAIQKQNGIRIVQNADDAVAVRTIERGQSPRDVDVDIAVGGPGEIDAVSRGVHERTRVNQGQIDEGVQVGGDVDSIIPGSCPGHSVTRDGDCRSVVRSKVHGVEARVVEINSVEQGSGCGRSIVRIHMEAVCGCSLRRDIVEREVADGVIERHPDGITALSVIKGAVGNHSIEGRVGRRDPQAFQRGIVEAGVRQREVRRRIAGQHSDDAIPPRVVKRRQREALDLDIQVAGIDPREVDAISTRIGERSRIGQQQIDIAIVRSQVDRIVGGKTSGDLAPLHRHDRVIGDDINGIIARTVEGDPVQQVDDRVGAVGRIHQQRVQTGIEHVGIVERQIAGRVAEGQASPGQSGIVERPVRDNPVEDRVESGDSDPFLSRALERDIGQHQRSGRIGQVAFDAIAARSVERAGSSVDIDPDGAVVGAREVDAIVTWTREGAGVGQRHGHNRIIGCDLNPIIPGTRPGHVVARDDDHRIRGRGQVDRIQARVVESLVLEHQVCPRRSDGGGHQAIQPRVRGIAVRQSQQTRRASCRIQPNSVQARRVQRTVGQSTHKIGASVGRHEQSVSSGIGDGGVVHIQVGRRSASHQTDDAVAGRIREITPGQRGV